MAIALIQCDVIQCDMQFDVIIYQGEGACDVDTRK